ncbi:MAG: adenylate/guanylate cyclase domain-containing protein, partial [Pseudobdellovibrio sp.]
MIKKFQNKLLLAFGILIVFIIALVLQTVNTTIDTVSQVRIENDLQSAQKVFEDFAEAKRKAKSEAADSLIKFHPVLRAILGSHGSNSEDLFGDRASQPAESTEDLNLKLYSTVESLDIFQNSDIFAITDEKAGLLFSKTAPKASQIDLSDLEIIKTALSGHETVTHWGSEQESLQRYSLLPKTKDPTVFEVFVKPIVFANEVKGLMIVGFSISSQDLQELQKVTRAQISFSINGKIYGDTRGVPENIKDLLAKNQDRLVEIKKGDESLLSFVSKLKQSDVSDAASIIFRSKNEELSFYTNLKSTLNWIGLAGILIALVFSVFISTGVTRSIRELLSGVQQVHLGNLNHLVQVKSHDEFKTLADEFNLMTAGLREKEMIKSTFKRYISPRIANLLLGDQQKLKLGGDKRRLIIYFADIAGFTTLSEKLSPEATIDFLNTYLSKVSQVIENDEGIIDKFIGDAVMAYWIIPATVTDYENRVCRVALRHCEIVQSLKEEYKLKSADFDFDVRIGIHSGEAIMGNIGSTERMDFTIIGDNVNLASRLESINKQYGSKIIVSEDTFTAAQNNFIFRELDNIRVVGKTRTVKIFELLTTSEQNTEALTQLLSEFKSGYEKYCAGDFSAAAGIFSRTAAEDPV